MPETVREPTRIFSQSRAGWNAGLLVMGALALFLGVFGAVRLQRDEHLTSPPAIAEQTAAPATSSPAVGAPQNPVATQALASRESTAAPAPATTPAAASAAPAVAKPATPLVAVAPAAPSVQAPALAQLKSAPAATASNGATANRAATAGPRYWVEFGAYVNSRYAQRLKIHLEHLGIKTIIKKAHGAHGREYLRVRTSSESARPAALAAWSKAHQALHIRPLLHRVSTRHMAAAAPANGHAMLAGTVANGAQGHVLAGTLSMAGGSFAAGAPPGA